MNMTAFDVAILILLVISFIYGMRRGLIMELSTLLGVLVGIWGATHFSYIVQDYISSRFDFQYSGIIAFALTVIIIAIIVHFLATWISKMLKATFLSSVNGLLGGLFSSLKALFLVSCLLYVCTKYAGDEVFLSYANQEKSYSYKPVVSMAQFIIDIVDIPSKEDVMKVVTDVEDEIKQLNL